MTIKNIIFDLEGVLGYYPEVESFLFYDTVLANLAKLDEDYNLYYLTNVLDQSGSYFNQHVTVTLQETGFVGGLGSNNYSFAKPDKRFYQELLRRYRLEPTECLFIDDKKVNVFAARDLGMESFIHTKNGQGLLEQIQKFIVRCNNNL